MTAVMQDLRDLSFALNAELSAEVAEVKRLRALIERAWMRGWVARSAHGGRVPQAEWLALCAEFLAHNNVHPRVPTEVTDGKG